MRVAVLLALALAAGCSPRPQGPNLLLVSLDTLRADHLRLYGYERDTSARLEALAADGGVVFDRAIAQSSWTLPSHRSLFASQPASRAPGSEPTLAQWLERAGYRTVAFTGGLNVSGRLGLARGFERYEEELRPFAERVERVLDWLAEEGDEPFFLFVHTYEIHAPYDPPTPYDYLYEPNYGGFVQGEDTPRVLAEALKGLHEEGSDGLDERDRQRIVDLYDGGIHYTDRLLGRLLDGLKELSLYESTVIVVLSDHGEELWDHGRLLHGLTLYQEQLHVPLVIREAGPVGSRPPRRVAAQVRLLDVAPTVVELLGLPVPAEWQGESLVPLMRGEQGVDRPALAEARRSNAWLEPPWKVVSSEAGRELYDLEADPGETRDLSEEHPEVAERLEGAARAAGAGEVLRLEEEVARIEGDDSEELRAKLRALGYLDALDLGEEPAPEAP